MPPARARMPLPDRLRRWFAPAPDSALAQTLRRGKSGWSEAVHLLWSAWIFLTPLFGGGFGLRWVLLTALSYPLFLLLYLRALVAPARRLQPAALGMVALGLGLLPWYPSAVTYFVFGGVMLQVGCRRTALLPYLAQVAVLGLLYLGVAWWAGYPWQMWVWVPVMTLIIGIIVHVEDAAQQREDMLRLSQEEVRRLAASAERERIGRDLHDLLGHTLSLIALKLELARKLGARDPAAAAAHVAEAERVARQALAEVRSAVSGIRAADLAAELAAARLLLESAGVAFAAPPLPQALPPALQAPLALVLREAATNIARHARARAVRVALRREDGGIVLEIADDGRGGVRTEGNGLAGMRERVAALGGRLALVSPPGAGTRLRVWLPWPEDRPAAATPDGVPAAVAPEQPA